MSNPSPLRSSNNVFIMPTRTGTLLSAEVTARNYEGDFLERVRDDYIRVMRDGGEMPDAALAIIHLQKGDSVKELT